MEVVEDDLERVDFSGLRALLEGMHSTYHSIVFFLFFTFLSFYLDHAAYIIFLILIINGQFYYFTQ